MKLLAIETATEACSVAVLADGQVRERFAIAPRRHAELVLPWADELLAEAGIARSALDAIAVGRGPGAFTGVRLAIALAQGIALALDRPLVPVSTLAVLAAQGPDGEVLAALDARMGEVYLGAFRVHAGEPVPLAPEAVGPPTTVPVPDGVGWTGLGTGFAAIEGALATRLGERMTDYDASALPQAADLARLAAQAFARGEAIAADRIEPAYLRDRVALTLAEQQAKRAG
jgi:tRNA threonylcarbamoyladenosine biosynthesis protein TsaB